MGEPAKTKAAPVKKTQQAAAKKTPQQGSGLKLSTWAPGEVEAPRTDPRGGRPLDPSIRASMESRFGHDFGRVRIHTGPEANRSAAELGAHAYTLGLDVFFQAGRYRPEHTAGRALIVHELEHVVRAGPRGPAVPMLQPGGAIDFEAKLKEIFAAKGGRDASLRKFVQAHPTSIQTAERLLTAKAVDAATTPVLLGVLFKLDKDSEERVAALLRNNTSALRREAVSTTRKMWDNYEAAAYQYAWLQWVLKRLGEEKKKRPPTPRGAKPPEPTLLERQYETWKAQYQEQLDKLSADRAGLLKASNAALAAMMNAAKPLVYVQGDILDSLSDMTLGTIADARKVRIETYADTSLLERTKTPWVESQLKEAQKRLDQAREAEKKARAERNLLEQPPAPAPSPRTGSPATPATLSAPPTPETPAQKKRREARLAAAKASEARTIASREKAEKALTFQGATDPQVKQYLESQDPATRDKAKARLRTAQGPLFKKLSPLFPKSFLPGLDPKATMKMEDVWWIYHTALNSLESGFPNFTAELTTEALVSQRSAVADNRRALGVGADAAFATYAHHGAGQYDIHVPAGETIAAVQPDTVDLTEVLDRGAQKKRIFTHVSSQVLSAGVLTEAAANDDVLAKLLHGYFGFHQTDRDKMKAHLAGTGGFTPSPDVSRILGALTFVNTLANTPPSQDVVDDLNAIRAALETALHTELRNLAKQPVDIPDTVDILQTVDAGSGGFGWFGHESTVTKNAVEEIRKVRGKITSSQAKALVFDAVRRIVLTDATVSDPLKALMSKLLGNDIGNRSGPWVTLLHHYKEVGATQEAWIEVDYRHLHDVSVTAGAKVESDTLIGKVGSSGNSISPHIHMAIRVYTEDPRKQGVQSIGHLLPDEFFPFGRKGKKTP
ncbi:MAG TPA: DUF4157 domain-containing protein [Thermoanaerobaculia bacterium]|jgi:hypothetical protein|nr:DUF4157 domain-containing protein [Thermoanaerobaculia bacterium]